MQHEAGSGKVTISAPATNTANTTEEAAPMRKPSTRE